MVYSMFPDLKIPTLNITGDRNTFNVPYQIEKDKPFYIKNINFYRTEISRKFTLLTSRLYMFDLIKVRPEKEDHKPH